MTSRSYLNNLLGQVNENYQMYCLSEPGDMVYNQTLP